MHLLPLPGAPCYDGNLSRVYEQALHEADILIKNGVDAIIIENFRDKPFYPTRVPVETVTALSAVSRKLKNKVNIPIGINVLRNDAEAAIAIATAIGAQFMRVNTHMGAVVSEQGIIQGLSHQSLRLRSNLKSNVAIFADVGVKHAAPLADRGLATEAKDLQNRGLADALIVSGALTGEKTSTTDIEIVKENSQLPSNKETALRAEALVWERSAPLPNRADVMGYAHRRSCRPEGRGLYHQRMSL